MTRLLIIFLLLFFPLLLSANDFAGAGERFEEIDGRGLVIRTNPQGVRVFINGVERGLAPVTFENLAAGQYHVRLSREGYKEHEFTVTVFNNSRLVATIDMELLSGMIFVSVNKAPGSPEQLPFSPGIQFRSLQGRITSSHFSNNDKTLLTLSAGHQTIRAFAFGWEDTSVTVLVEDETTAEANIFMQPAAFRLENISQNRRRINPSISGNLGAGEYRFEVSAPGKGTFSILNSAGSVVYTRQLERFTSREQLVIWNGIDSSGNLLPQGIYTVLIEAIPEFRQGETETLSIETEINYSSGIFPQLLENGIAGMAFSPLPHVLPAGSYQIESGILFSSFGFPFKVGLRAAPVNRLELTAIFNVNVDLENETGWGICGSVKYNLIDGSAIVPLVFSAGVSYAWTNEYGEYPLSPGKGIGFYTPLSLELSNFSIVLCPSAFWHGPEGFAPELLLSAGLLYRGSWVTGGVSTRYEFDFTEDTAARFLAGAEVHFVPPSTNFVFSVHGGILLQDSQIKGYGSIGIGMIY